MLAAVLATDHGTNPRRFTISVTDTVRPHVSALLNLSRPASPAELADITGRTAKTVSHALAKTRSIVRVSRFRYGVDTPDGALGSFAAAAMQRCDDVGLINVDELRAFAAANGYAARFDEFVETCGFPTLSGHLAVDATEQAAVKAVLLKLNRPASRAEIAAEVGQPVKATLSSIRSLVPLGTAKWVAKETCGGTFAEFAAVLALCQDDVGLIDEDRLGTLAAEYNWDIPLNDLVEVCGLVRLSGHLSAAGTAAAAAKAALKSLGPATLHELEEITGYSYSTILSGLAESDSVERLTTGNRGSGGGLLRVRDLHASRSVNATALVGCSGPLARGSGHTTETPPRGRWRVVPISARRRRCGWASPVSAKRW